MTHFTGACSVILKLIRENAMEFLRALQEYSHPTHKVHVYREEAIFMNISINTKVI